MATLIKTAILTVKDFDTPMSLTKKLVELSNDGFSVTKVGANLEGIMQIILNKSIPI